MLHLQESISFAFVILEPWTFQGLQMQRPTRVACDGQLTDQPVKEPVTATCLVPLLPGQLKVAVGATSCSLLSSPCSNPPAAFNGFVSLLQAEAADAQALAHDRLVPAWRGQLPMQRATLQALECGRTYSLVLGHRQDWRRLPSAIYLKLELHKPHMREMTSCKPQ